MGREYLLGGVGMARGSLGFLRAPAREDGEVEKEENDEPADRGELAPPPSYPA
jgi:hypothetical protein